VDGRARHPADMAEPLILLVEDDPRLRDLLERYLASQALRVRAVANLAGMRAQLAQHHVDLIVLDLMLPDGDGLTACRDLRAAGDETPILILTARGDDVDRIIGLEIGADDYLPKPCNPRICRSRAIRASYWRGSALFCGVDPALLPRCTSSKRRRSVLATACCILDSGRFSGQEKRFA